MDSITRIGAIFLFYLFIVLISYFIMSTPVELLFEGFENADFGIGETYKDNYMPIYRQVFTIAMGFLLAIPVTWLIMKIFSREPDYSRFRRY